jgi:radical SAM superfamily enzyme YgiQ (UPF0313 family)
MDVRMANQELVTSPGFGRCASTSNSHPVVVLINPAPLRQTNKAAGVRERYPFPPVGLLSIAGQLLMHGYQPVILDFFRESFSSRAAFEEVLRGIAARPVLVGISTYTETAAEMGKITNVVRDVWPETFIVLGGPHATFCAEEVLGSCPAVDAVVRNEGEGAVIELLEHLRYPEGLPMSDILGLVFRQPDCGLISTGARPFLSSLDCLPLPPFHLLPVSVARTDDVIFVFMTSRGCPGNCIFCSSRAMAGPSYRMHSAEYLAALVLHEHERIAFTGMGVMDDTFLVNVRRLERFCRLLAELGIGVPWTCKSRVDTLRPRVLRTLRQSGCRSIHIGVETGDDEVLEAIDKRITLKGILDGIVAMKAYGIRPECSFIIGHHCDTLESIERTLLLASAIRDDDIGIAIVGICTPLPGTPLFRRAPELGVRFITSDWSRFDLSTPVFETENFTAHDIKRAQYYFDVEAIRGGKLALSGSDHEEYRKVLSEFVARVKAATTEGVTDAA